MDSPNLEEELSKWAKSQDQCGYDLERIIAVIEIVWAVTSFYWAIGYPGSGAAYEGLGSILPHIVWAGLFAAVGVGRFIAIYDGPAARRAITILSASLCWVMVVAFWHTSPIPGCLLYAVYAIANIVVIRRLRGHG
jgi:hypothetical protein